MKEVNLTESLENSFAKYAGAVIQNRAIIDVRDGLKPSQRMLMYAQYIEKLTNDKPFKKATKSVAAGMSHFYVHGDSSAYSTLIRMGKPFAIRYPLQAVQGAYGNQMASDNESASRYVEMKLSKLGTKLFDSINKETIEPEKWRENYDNTEIYPSVLPSIGFYGLVQGSTGIGVALAASIPQFNLREVNEALVKLLWNRDIAFDDIYCEPDFSTGATIINKSEIKESIRNGTGSAIKIRATIEENIAKNQLIVTELPYGVYTNTICKQLATLMEEENSIITEFLDLTGEKPLLKITIDKKVGLERAKQFLYKNTHLQSYYSVNMTMLEDGKFPKVFGFKEALTEYLKHSENILRNETNFDLRKAKNRVNILNGYLKALSIIDEVVATIKAQKDTKEAIAALISKFEFNEIQAKAILELKLSRLVNLEIEKLKNERDKLLKTIEGLEERLNNKEIFLKEIENRLLEVSKEYGDDRRTTVVDLSEDSPVIEEKAIIAYVSNSGAIITKELNSITTQKRKTTGEKIKFTNKKDTVWKTIVGKTTEQVLVFTTLGKSYVLSLSDLDLNQELFIDQLLSLEVNEFITSIMSFTDAKDYKYVMFITKDGTIKKTDVKEYLTATKRKGYIAIKLREDDMIIDTKLIKDNEDIMVVSSTGHCVRFNHNLIAPTGRNTIGIKGINLKEKACVVGMDTITNDSDELIIITKNGNGKRIELSALNKTNKAVLGNIIHKLEESDEVADFITVSDKFDEVIINSKTNSLKLKVSAIPLLNGKNTGGSAIIRLADDNYVKNINAVEKMK